MNIQFRVTSKTTTTTWFISYGQLSSESHKERSAPKNVKHITNVCFLHNPPEKKKERKNQIENVIDKNVGYGN